MRRFTSISWRKGVTEPKGRHVKNYLSRQETIVRLRDVGRVNAPEADMRPVLPHRELLLKSLSASCSSPQAKPRTEVQSRYREKDSSALFLHDLIEQVKRHAQNFDLESLSDTLSIACSPPPPLSAKRCIHATTLTVLHHIPPSPSSLNLLLNHLSSLEILQTLPSSTLAPIFDMLIAASLRYGDIPAARRGELFSRLLDVSLRPGTYAALIKHVEGLELGVGLLHRSIASHPPTASLLNATLDLCLRERDGTRARGVLHELTLRNLLNGDTIRLLAQQAPNANGVEAIQTLAREAGVEATETIMEAYVRVREPGRAFLVLDNAFDDGKFVDRKGLEFLIHECARSGNLEAALRGWREIRRSWGGVPGRRARKALCEGLAKHESPRYEFLIERLKNVASPSEQRKMHRAILRSTRNDEADQEALNGNCVKNCATVLHRWAREDRLGEVQEWLKRRREESGPNQGVDIRLVLSLLSDEGGKGQGLKWFLEELGAGVYGEGVLDRTVDAIWEWILKGSRQDQEDSENWETNKYNSTDHDLQVSTDKAELRFCLEKVIRLTKTSD